MERSDEPKYSAQQYGEAINERHAGSPISFQWIGMKACPVDKPVPLWCTTCMKPQRFTIYIDPSLLERLKKVAKDNKRSANSEIVYAIEKHIEKQEKGK